jgi:hypothetical protein
MTKPWRRGLLIIIPTWLVIALIFDLVAGVGLSIAAFLTGGGLVMGLGLFLVVWDRPPRLALRLPILYSSIVLFSLSSVSFAYSYIVANSSILFYLAGALLILGSGSMLAGMKTSPRPVNSQGGYSMNRLRLWGFLLGIGFPLGIVFTVFMALGVQLSLWIMILLAALGFGLGEVSLLGLWLELKKPKR